MEDALEKDPQSPIFTCQPIIWSVYDMFQMKSILENLKILLIQFFMGLSLQSQDVVGGSGENVSEIF